MSNVNAQMFNVPKIAIFSLAYAPLIGGAEIAIKEIVNRSPEFNFSCFTFRFDKNWPAVEVKNNLKIIRVGQGIETPKHFGDYYQKSFKKIIYIFQAWRAAEKDHRQEPFSFIWGMMAAYGGAAALLFKLRHPSVPFLLTLQEGDPEEYILNRVGPLYLIWKLIFKKADHLQVISAYLKDLGRKHGVKAPISIIPNGVDLGLINKTLENPDPQIEKQFEELDSKDPVIITTSRLVTKNGVDLLIKAIGQLKARYPKIKCFIVGDGPDRQELEALAARLNIKENVIFTGYQTQEKTYSYLKFSDIFVRASRSEGLGNSFLEAMAAGLPIIGTPVGGIVDFLIDRETGLLVKPENDNDLFEKLLELITNRNLRGRLADRGKELIFKNYDWELVANKMKTLFKKLASPKILITTGVYPPAIGGPATYVFNLAPRLLENSYQVKILTYALDTALTEVETEKGGLEIISVSKNISKLLNFFNFFRYTLRLGRSADLIYCQGVISEGLPTALANLFLRKKLVIRITGDYAWEQLSNRQASEGPLEFQNQSFGLKIRFLKFTQKLVARLANEIVVPSEYLKQILLHWRLDHQKIHVINNAVLFNEENKFEKRQAPRPKTKINILTAGRLIKLKNIDKIINTIAGLAENFSLTIAGAGPLETQLKELIGRLNLQNRVKLIGSIAAKDLPDYYKSADLFVLLSQYETFPHVVIEAMSYGLPVIASARGGITEIVDNEKNGLLIEPNENLLKNAIVRLSQDSSLYQRLSKNSFKRSRDFTWSNHLAKLLPILKL